MAIFKFGKQAAPRGPLDQYVDPVSHIKSSVGVTQGQTRKIITASGVPDGYLSSTLGSGAPDSTPNSHGASIGKGSSGYNVDRYNPVFDQLEEGSILEDWIPRDAAGLDLLFRRIYLRDPTIGPGIDLISNLPWSDFVLDGIKDEAIKKIYLECMEAIQPQLLMPDITRDYLVVGKDIASLIFDERRGIFSGVIPHDPDFIKITPIPVYGFDPMCDFKLSPGFKKFLTSTDPRAMDARKALPVKFLEAAASDQGFLPLDPVATIYLARKASQIDQIGTSLLTRTLYFWGIEKALLNAQLASTRRRARSFVHMKAGIDGQWEPSPEEMDSLAGMIIQANEDPTGGVIVTRTGVDISEPVGSGADMYKWSDELELFAKYKMQSIGISDALLSGDATYNNAEQARSVFVETLANLRSRIVQKFYMEKMFPAIARVHGFVKRTKAEIDHNIRISNPEKSPEDYFLQSAYPEWAKHTSITAGRLTQRKAMSIPVSQLEIPIINWTKQLKPNQDEKALEILEKLKQNDYPVTLAQWANAAGLNAKNIEAETKADFELQGKIDQARNALGVEEGEGEGGGGGGGGGGGEEETIEVPPASEAQPPGEAALTSYQKAKIIGSGRVKKLSDIAIWHRNKCGPLGRSEAAKIINSILKEYSSEILRDRNALLQKINDRTRNHEKTNILSYIFNRWGLADLPVDPKVAQMIAASARDAMNRHSSFKTQAALLDYNRYGVEVNCLAKMLGNSKKKINPEEVKKALSIANPLGTRVLSGV
jgi:hypothetical protein